MSQLCINYVSLMHQLGMAMAMEHQGMPAAPLPTSGSQPGEGRSPQTLPPPSDSADNMASWVKQLNNQPMVK